MVYYYLLVLLYSLEHNHVLAIFKYYNGILAFSLFQSGVKNASHIIENKED